MSFVTKAIAATGATAIVALGGGAALANLHGSVEAATAPTIVATGHIAAIGASCTPWVLAGGERIEQATPDSTVISTCTVNVSGATASTQATAALADDFNAGTSLKKYFDLEANVEHEFAHLGSAQATNVAFTDQQAGTTVPLVVTVTATIPAADQAELADSDAAAEFTAALSNVVVTFNEAQYLGIPAGH